MPFTRYFYFKKDTPADTDWKIKAKERNGAPARELGGYNPYDKMGWNDELLVKERGIVEPKVVRELLVKDARVRVVDGGLEREGEGEEELMGRFGESDKKRDERMLDRKMDRTLYVVVKRENGGWGFPAGELEGRENLHQVCFPFGSLSYFSSLNLSLDLGLGLELGLGFSTNRTANRQQNASSSKPPAST
jgi:large subunit ribosomal protein L46